MSPDVMCMKVDEAGKAHKAKRYLSQANCVLSRFYSIVCLKLCLINLLQVNNVRSGQASTQTTKSVSSRPTYWFGKYVSMASMPMLRGLPIAFSMYSTCPRLASCPGERSNCCGGAAVAAWQDNESSTSDCDHATKCCTVLAAGADRQLINPSCALLGRAIDAVESCTGLN